MKSLMTFTLLVVAGVTTRAGATLGTEYYPNPPDQSIIEGVYASPKLSVQPNGKEGDGTPFCGTHDNIDGYLKYGPAQKVALEIRCKARVLRSEPADAYPDRSLRYAGTYEIVFEKKVWEDGHESYRIGKINYKITESNMPHLIGKTIVMDVVQFRHVDILDVRLELKGPLDGKTHIEVGWQYRTPVQIELHGGDAGACGLAGKRYFENVLGIKHGETDADGSSAIVRESRSGRTVIDGVPAQYSVLDVAYMGSYGEFLVLKLDNQEGCVVRRNPPKL